MCFFFSSRRRHTRSLRDWSSDVCSSDLARAVRRRACCAAGAAPPGGPLFEAGDHILRQLRFAVARGLELRERLEALAHPLVVHPVLGARRVQLVRLDRLLLERKYLLLEQ